MRVQQLRLDLEFDPEKNDIDNVYEELKSHIKNMDGVTLVDDDHAPYFEDLTEQYEQLRS